MLVRIGTVNDRNGNPRRGWLHIDERGKLLNWIEEDYLGRSAIEQFTDGETLKINVPIHEYKRLKTLGTQAGLRQEQNN